MSVPGSLLAAVMALGVATAGAGVAGRVLNAEGLPIAGATVEAFERESAEQTGERRVAGQPRTPLATVKTAADGSFRIDLKRPFAWVQAGADRHAPEIAAADSGAPTLLTLTRAAQRRGVITAGGRPVAGAVVIWFSGAGAELPARTAKDGTFEAPDPEMAPGQLAILHPDFAPHMASVSAGGAARGLDQQLEAGAPLSGSAVDAAGGKPVAGASVWIDETWPLARTDAKGAFHIPHAPREWTNVTVRTRQTIGAVQRKPGPLVVTMKPSRTLSGTVLDAGTRQPLAGATVVVNTATGATLNADTDPRGQYALSGLPPGRYHPYAGRVGYASGPARPYQGKPIDLRTTRSARFDATLTRLPHVQGRVQDEEHRPVDAAMVGLGFKDTPHFYSANAWSTFGTTFGGSGGGATRTATDGSFTLALPTDDETSEAAFLLKDRPLTVLKRGFAAARARVDGNGKPSPLVVTLSRGIELHGRITGVDGAPIGGVAVTAAEDGSFGGSLMPAHLMLTAMKHEGWTTSDEAGRFSIRVHPAEHHVAFRKAGHAPKLARGHDPRAGQPLDVVLEPAAAVRGRVSRPDGRGVDGVQIAVGSQMGMGGETATTSADGAFEVTDLAPGVYQLTAGHEELGINERRTVEAPATDLQIVLGSTVTLRGQAIDAASRQPVPRFQVTVQGEGGSSARTVEADDAGGAFTVPEVSVGDVSVTVTAEGYASKQVDGLSLEAGIDPDALEILLDADAPIRGRVTSDGGGPVADAYVSLDKAIGDVIPRSDVPRVAADEDGEYELRGVPPGEATLSFWAQGFVTEKRTIDSRQSSRLDVTLKRGLTLRGEVLKSGAGVPNVFVSAQPSAQGATYQTAQTDARGRFTLEGLVPGRYTVSANARGQGSANVEDVDVETAGPLRLVLDKAATAVLTGKVVGLPEGGDAAMVMVMAANEETDESGQASLDASRSFRMNDAPAGRVQVRAFAASLDAGATRTSRTVELNLAPGSETETVIEFSNEVAISGTVLRDGTGVPHVMVAFSGAAEQASAARTDARGAYQAVGLAPGRYQVQVSGDDVSFETDYVVTASAEFDIDITGGSIDGRVVRADGGTPLPGVEVSLFRIVGSENTPTHSVTSGSQGAFSQRSLREGRYRLITSKPGFGQEVRELEVPRGGAAEVVLELTPAEGVSVTVVDARDSRPLDAIVVVRDQARRIVANRHSGVGDDGTLNIPLANGSYILSTSASGYGTATLPVTAPAQGLRVGLTPGGTLVIESARDLRGRVQLIQPDGEEYVRCWCNGIAEIQLKGRRTSVENVTPGAYTVQLIDLPEGAEPRPVVIREGQTSTVAID